MDARTTFLTHDLNAALFDLDGVITSTSALHFGAWKRLFDPLLRQRAAETGAAFVPFTLEDNEAHVDGLPRIDGLTTFLSARGIELPLGDTDDPEHAPTRWGLCALKNRYFNELLDSQGVDVYDATRTFVTWIRAQGWKTAIVSSSKNARKVLGTAGLDDLFDVIVDGLYAAEHALPGKPEPDTFLTAARLLGTTHDRAVVFEDAPSGVEAGRKGDFGLVVGIDRGAGRDTLRDHGADIVVNDLGDFTLD